MLELDQRGLFNHLVIILKMFKALEESTIYGIIKMHTKNHAHIVISAYDWNFLSWKLKFDICVRCIMAFIEPMHHVKPNITSFLGIIDVLW